MDFEDDAILIIFSIAILLVWIGGSAIQRRRQRAYRNIAEEMNFQFIGTSWSRLLSNKPAIVQKKRIQNLMTRIRNDIEIEFFEHLVGGGKSAYWTPVAVFASGKLNLPNFELYPKGVFGRVTAAFGAQDPDFNAHTRFSDLFVIRGEKHPIEKAFSQEIADRLIAQPNVSLEGSAQTLVYFTDDKRFRPGDVEQFIKEGLDLTRLFIQQANPST